MDIKSLIGKLHLHQKLDSLPGSTKSSGLSVLPVLGIFLDSLNLNQKKDFCKKSNSVQNNAELAKLVLAKTRSEYL